MATTLAPIIAKAATAALTPPAQLQADRDGFPLQGCVIERSGLRTTGGPDLSLPVTVLDCSAPGKVITFTQADVNNAQGKTLSFCALTVGTNAFQIVFPAAIVYRGTGAVATSVVSTTTTSGSWLSFYFADATHVYCPIATNATFT